MSDDNVTEFQPRLINQWPRKVYLADFTKDGSELRVYEFIQRPDDTTPRYVRGDLYEAQAARIRELEAERDSLREKLQEAGQALTQIERLYYTEGKDASWRAVQMRGIAHATLAGEGGG